MKIIFGKEYKKQFKKLSPKLRVKVINTVQLFIENSFHRRLHNHALKGALMERRAISVNSDLRIIFLEYDHYSIVVFIDIGTHNRVY